MSEGKPEGYVESKSRFFDWQFFANPVAGEQPPFLVGELDGRIVAANGVMPVQVIYKRRPLAAIWSCDTFVAAAQRGRGLGKAMLKAIGEQAPLVLGFGITDMSDPILAKNGWELNPDVTSYFCSVNEPGLRGRLKYLRSALRRALAPGRPRSGPAEVLPDDFGSEVDELWQRSAGSYESVVVRDAAYLNWRYRRHPRLSYTCHAVRGGDRRLAGILIARHHPFESVIVDYCGPRGEGGVIGPLIAAAVADLSRRGTARIRCETTDPVVAAELSAMGFFPYSERPRFRVRSNLPGDVDPSRGWFLMSGDSDHDLLRNPD